MDAKPSVAILDHFSALDDPREGWRVVYPLPEILLVVLCDAQQNGRFRRD